MCPLQSWRSPGWWPQCPRVSSSWSGTEVAGSAQTSSLCNTDPFPCRMGSGPSCGQLRRRGHAACPFLSAVSDLPFRADLLLTDRLVGLAGRQGGQAARSPGPAKARPPRPPAGHVPGPLSRAPEGAELVKQVNAPGEPVDKLCVALGCKSQLRPLSPDLCPSRESVQRGG